jgi:hypothetical protein
MENATRTTPNALRRVEIPDRWVQNAHQREVLRFRGKRTVNRRRAWAGRKSDRSCFYHLATVRLTDSGKDTMINIQRFFENHLANREISAEELRQFAEDHIGKLKALPSLPANLTALIGPTGTAFDDFDGKLSARATLQAAQSGGTITKDEALQLFRTTVRQREGRVRDKFAKGSARYAEFYPQGLKEYNKARLGQVPALLDRFIAAATRYQADLGPELLAEFTALKAAFATARDGQVEAKGELAQARANLASARAVLEFQLGRNILAIASHHLGHPEQAATYLNQALLDDPTRSNEGEAPSPPTA